MKGLFFVWSVLKDVVCLRGSDAHKIFKDKTGKIKKQDLWWSKTNWEEYLEHWMMKWINCKNKENKKLSQIFFDPGCISRGQSRTR